MTHVADITKNSMAKKARPDENDFSGLIRLNDSLTVKRCEPLPRHAIRLSSDNPGYEPYTAKKGEYEVLGAVVAVIKVLK